jgi:hypothetical protein
VLAIAIPTVKAPIIGDSPTNAAILAAPKNEAVTIPSTVPLDLHKFSTRNSCGTSTTAPTSDAQKIPISLRLEL